MTLEHTGIHVCRNCLSTILIEGEEDTFPVNLIKTIAFQELSDPAQEKFRAATDIEQRLIVYSIMQDGPIKNFSLS